MRTLLTSILILISLASISNDKIVLKSKPLNKDIKKQFGIIDYQKTPIKTDSTVHINGGFYILNTEDSSIGYLYTGRINSCRTGGCSIEREHLDEENFEYFDYYILFDKNRRIKNVRVFNYQATHGQEVSSQAWLKQFRGHKAEDKLQVGKNIDAISGATISVYAITANIDYISKVIMEI